MNCISNKAIYILLVLVLCFTGSQAQIKLNHGHILKAKKTLMQSAGIESFDEELGTETGAMGDVPIDGGLSVVLAAGAAYGAHRLRRQNRKNINKH